MLKKIAHLSAAFVLIASSALADTVILKSGEKVEGKIISNTDAGVTVQVRLAGGITDERVIKKAEIEENGIKQAMPDDEAWAALKAVTPGDDSIEADAYARSIKLLGDFVTQFPKSPNAAEAQKRVAAFEEEKKRVESGELKVGGKWLTKEQVEEDRVQIKGRQLYAVMKRQAANRQLVDAMNTFSVLEKSAEGSTSYPEAVVIARQVLPLLRTAAETRRTQLKAQVDENKRRLSNLQGAEKQQLEELQKRQTAQNDALVRAEEVRGLKWLPLIPSNDRSIGALLSRTGSELTSVNRMDLDKMRVSISLAEKAKTALNAALTANAPTGNAPAGSAQATNVQAANDITTAEKALSEASSTWPANEMVKRLQPRIIEARVKVAKAAAQLASAPPPIVTDPVHKPAAPTPAPTPAEPVAAEEPPKEDDSSAFSKPTFWIILIIVLGAAAFAMKFLRKLKDRAKDLLDQ